jgi:hypothetical protein
MNIGIISIICFLFVVIQIAEYTVAFEPIEGQVIDEKDLMLRTNTIMDPTKNNETKLVRHKQYSCCIKSDWKCCCKSYGRECVSGGWGASRPQNPCPSHVRIDCGGCRRGWRC